MLIGIIEGWILSKCFERKRIKLKKYNCKKKVILKGCYYYWSMKFLEYVLIMFYLIVINVYYEIRMKLRIN